MENQIEAIEQVKCRLLMNHMAMLETANKNLAEQNEKLTAENEKLAKDLAEASK